MQHWPLILTQALFELKNCPDYEETDYGIGVLRKGSIVYHGSCLPHKFKDNKFWAFHALGKSTFKELDEKERTDEDVLRKRALAYDNFILFVSQSKQNAEGYADCWRGFGIVNKFELIQDFVYLQDLDWIGHETKYVGSCICDAKIKKLGISGYGVNYPDGTDEYAICEPEKFLRYIGSV